MRSSSVSSHPTLRSSGKSSTRRKSSTYILTARRPQANARSLSTLSRRARCRSSSSAKAGGTGLNLTAADYVAILDPWWNPAIESQASDRAYRIGQENPVTIYRLIAENTIEEKIIRLHETKKSLADALLEGSDMSNRLSREEILKLLAED